MGFLKKWNLAEKAYNLAGIIGDFVRNVDWDRLIDVVVKVVELERQFPRGGHGMAKADRLADWWVQAFPAHAGEVATVRALAKAFVALANAVGLFKKGAE